MVVTQYLHTVFNINEFRVNVQRTIKVAKYIKLLKKFDSIAFTGISGASMAPILSYDLGVSLLAVRKLDDSHSRLEVEGNVNSKRYLIVDDCIASGRTMETIIEKIAKVSQAKPVAILLYNQRSYYDKSFVHNKITIPVYTFDI